MPSMLRSGINLSDLYNCDKFQRPIFAYIMISIYINIGTWVAIISSPNVR
jgi:hypothetical protein